MKTLLFNPFIRYSEKQLLVTGILTATVGVFLATVTNTHFDGVLDTHFGENVTLITAASESLINTLSIVVVFFVLGKIINRKTRFIDILNIALIVKIPAYFLALFNINNWMHTATGGFMKNMANPMEVEFSTNDIVLLFFFSLVGFAVLAWLVTLLYNGFKIATNLKGIKHIIMFILAIIVSEIISKVLLGIL